VRVLVADDNVELVEFCRATLEGAGYEVVAAATGAEAVRAAESGRFDAAVLDVLMPGGSGDAVADRLRVAKPGLPVLLVTGTYGDPFVGPSSRPVLHKPFTPEQLVDAVRALIG
jgi:CheY-like chemotaxis protein